MARLVPFELSVNLALTIGFVAAYGAIGSAFAAVCSTALANFVLYPFLTRGFFSQAALLLVLRSGMLPALCGALPAGLTALALRHATDGVVPRLSLALPLSFALALLVGLGLLRASGRQQLRIAISSR
jgi:hypothetical protein